jgi:hypothetical protein
MDPVFECDHFIFVGVPYKDIQRDQYILGNSCLTQSTEYITCVVFVIQNSTHYNYIWKICVMIQRLSLFDDWLYINTLHETYEIIVVQNNKNA